MGKVDAQFGYANCPTLPCISCAFFNVPSSVRGIFLVRWWETWSQCEVIKGQSSVHLWRLRKTVLATHRRQEATHHNLKHLLFPILMHSRVHRWTFLLWLFGQSQFSTMSPSYPKEHFTLRVSCPQTKKKHSCTSRWVSLLLASAKMGIDCWHKMPHLQSTIQTKPLQTSSKKHLVRWQKILWFMF